MSIDRKASNGKGTNRFEMGTGSESTTVQTGKATASYSKLVKGEFTEKGSAADHGYVDLYSAHNVQELRTDAKKLRHQNPNVGKSGSLPVGPSRPGGVVLVGKPSKGKQPPVKNEASKGSKSDHAKFLTEKSEKYRGGGEKLS